jgi:hypothetical protein
MNMMHTVCGQVWCSKIGLMAKDVSKQKKNVFSWKSDSATKKFSQGLDFATSSQAIIEILCRTNLQLTNNKNLGNKSTSTPSIVGFLIWVSQEMDWNKLTQKELCIKNGAATLRWIMKRLHKAEHQITVHSKTYHVQEWCCSLIVTYTN